MTINIRLMLDDRWLGGFKRGITVTGNKAIAVTLLKGTTKIPTYGDLVTSIINPSHSIAKG
ncbi:MAG: hypothetical protein ACI854_000825 [Arenicella sp.]|jgi:hypothetical protein